MTRALAAARLYVVNKWTLIWIPLIVVGAMLALTVVIRVIMLAAHADPDTVYFNGAFQAAFWVLFGVAISASTQMFPFAFAMSLTRRTFWIGTVVVALAAAIGYGVLYALLAWLEQATDGYWIGAHGFDLMGFVPTPGSAFVLYGGVILFFFTLGFASSMLWKRFAGKGLVVAGLILVVALTALAAWAGLANAWPSVWRWATQQTPMSIGAIATGLSVLLAGASYLMIRHAEP